ncbi:MAG: UDP-N-acetylmuramate--L-alanine ligase, UDP-N-acetylmuramate--alanine ligase [Candidatus Parcubacteria bacterium]|jgi:UDP-N-acetylmuramate--alanine ligase
MKVYCIGIGGIGLSALARYFKYKGYEVAGSDAHSSMLIDTLSLEGMDIIIGDDEERITSTVDLVVYTIAIPETHPELMKARALGIRTLSYPEALGELTQEKTTIAVCGTHGKTTTTAMVYYALRACGVTPTVIVGSLLSEKGTNFIAGDSEYLVVEACEYKRSFLNIAPTHVIVTNIDADHLDYYKDIDDIRSAFQSFVDKMPEQGVLVTHQDVSLVTKGTAFTTDNSEKKDITLSVLGAHNKANALLVLHLLRHLGFEEQAIKKGLLDFRGTWRRLEYKGKTKLSIPVYDDYGHHPKEIAATVEALREKYPRDTHRLHMFFQPHLHSRTKLLFDDFVTVLKDIDTVSVLPIYKARKEDTSIVSEHQLIDAINSHNGNAEEVASLGHIQQVITSITDPNTVVLNIGAGDAYKELHKLELQ